MQRSDSNRRSPTYEDGEMGPFSTLRYIKLIANKFNEYSMTDIVLKTLKLLVAGVERIELSSPDRQSGILTTIRYTRIIIWRSL